ncbi:MAG: hypothetical protein ACK5D5_00875 [Bacteroidota bacterium]|jgi:hypothetical protein
MKRIPVVFCFIFISTFFYSKHKKVNLSEALKSKMVEINVGRVTGYQGKCLKLKMINLTADSVYVKVTPGWVFDSDDSTAQDLIVIKEFTFVLGKFDKKTEEIFVNCCERKKRSPTGCKFSKSKTPKKELVRLAEFLNKDDYPTNLICNAVWAVSDNAPISNICGGGADKDSLVRRIVAELLQKEIPWFNVITEINQLGDGHIETISKSLYGAFNCNISKGTEFEIKLIDRHGREILMLQPKTKAKDNLMNYYIEFNIEHLPRKEFFISFRDSKGVEMLKKEIDLRM